MRVVVVGLSHHTAPVEVRERVAVPAADLGDALAGLAAVDGVSEGVLLSTCNRTEAYAVVAEPEREAARLREFLAGLAKSPLEGLDGHLYAHREGEAVRHLFRVASSLDSMVIGESQILGQVKAAFAAAQATGLARGQMARLMERAFSVAKKVRTETSIGASTLSVSSAAVELARSIFGDLRGRSVLLVGAGKMGRLTLRDLRQAGVRSVFIANRTRERVAELVGEGEALDEVYVPLERVLDALERVDIALSSIALGRYLLEPAEAAALLRRRRGRPLFLVDISVPRSLDPEVHRIENVFLYDIDDLRAVVGENLKRRHAEAARAQHIVDGETSGFLASARELDVVPSIRAFLDRLEGIRQGELDRHLAARADLPPPVREAVEQATRAMMNKFAHGPIQELKRAVSSPDGSAVIEALRRALIEEELGKKGRRS